MHPIIEEWHRNMDPSSAGLYDLAPLPVFGTDSDVLIKWRHRQQCRRESWTAIRDVALRTEEFGVEAAGSAERQFAFVGIDQEAIGVYELYGRVCIVCFLQGGNGDWEVGWCKVVVSIKDDGNCPRKRGMATFNACILP